MTSDRIRRARHARTIVALLLSLTACSARPDGDAGAPDSLAGVRVGTAPVTAQEFRVEITTTGSVVARPGSFATLSAPSPTRVVKVFVEPGQHVRAGQPLIAFDRAPFAAAFTQAEAAAQAAQAAETRADHLVTQGIAPRRDLEQARAARAQAAAALIVARRSLEFATLRAPVSGIVSRLTAVLGATVDPAQPLVEVVNPDALEVRLALTAADAAAVRSGATVTLLTPSAAGAGSDSLGVARVTTIAPMVDSASGTVEVRAGIVSHTRLPRLGESVEAHVLLGTHAGALTVPVTALVPVEDHYQVFVVTAGDTARKREVTIGRRTASVVEILDGLRAGETVVTDGAFGVDDGAVVRAMGTATVRAKP